MEPEPNSSSMQSTLINQEDPFQSIVENVESVLKNHPNANGKRLTVIAKYAVFTVMYSNNK